MKAESPVLNTYGEVSLHSTVFDSQEFILQEEIKLSHKNKHLAIHYTELYNKKVQTKGYRHEGGKENLLPI